MRKYNVTLMCAGILMLFWLLVGYGAVESSSPFSINEGGAHMVNKLGEPVREAMEVPLSITTWDGMDIPYRSDESSAQSIWTTEDTPVTIDFGQRQPDEVTASLTYIYSGGSLVRQDPVSVPLAKESGTTYTLLLPCAETPIIFSFYQYDITARYGDMAYWYQFTVQLGPVMQVPGISITAQEGAMAEYSYAKVQWNGQIFAHEPLLQSAKFHLSLEPLLGEGGGAVRIDFGDNSPDSLTATTTLFGYGQSSGHYFAAEPETQELMQESDAVYSITLPHCLTSAKWAFDDNQGRIQGYTLTAVWGENICEYAFIVAIPRADS